MVCHRCSASWTVRIIANRRMKVCSECNFLDTRNGSVDNVPHGPDSPTIFDRDWKPATLGEHLSAWWRSRSSQCELR